VIVPAYNAADTLGPCLQALLNQTVPRELYEIVVVDDGSTDDTIGVALSYGVTVHRQHNQGPAAARNLGAQVAQGDLILFTDADCEPLPNWIEEMTKPFTNPGIMGTKGTYCTSQRSWVARFVQLEYEDKYDRMRKVPYIDFIDTYSAAYRREVFYASKGFDSAFRQASGEDVEFSYRLSSRGCKLVFVPSARVYHRHVASLWAYFRRKLWVGYWRVLMYQLHPSKIISDSHTPQVMKVQLTLVALTGIGVMAALLIKSFNLLYIACLTSLLFLLTTFPFVVKAMRKDKLVSLLSPFFLLVRTLALGFGFTAGIVCLWPRTLANNNE
jgi:glycosyltransferase involved in cell wall biosynthesis